MRVSHQVPWRTLASACVISGLVLSTNVATFADENGESAPLTVATQSDPQENPQNQEGDALLILPPDLHMCLRCVRSAFLFRSYDV